MDANETKFPTSNPKVEKGGEIFLVALQCDSEEQAEMCKNELANILFSDRISGRSRVRHMSLRPMNWFQRLIFIFKWKKYEIQKIS